MNPPLKTYIRQLAQDEQLISLERKKLLSRLVIYMRDKQAKGQMIHLTFICTHNSRRSHMGQIWASTLATFYGIKQVKTYSGGTESTAFNPRAIAAMRRAGFDIPPEKGDNPVYKVTYSPDASAVLCWSKKYDDAANPSQYFAAIMTCNDADVNCPLVAGADFRLPLTYEDPKAADDSPFEKERYDERVRQIGQEMSWLMKSLLVTPFIIRKKS